MKTNTPKMKKLFSKKNNSLNLKRVKEDFSGKPEDEDDKLSHLDDESNDFDFKDDEEASDLDLTDDEGMDDEVGGEEDMNADDELGDDVGGEEGMEDDLGDGDESMDGDKDLLKQMIMAIIDGDEEGASDALHQYMTNTTKDMLDDDSVDSDEGMGDDLGDGDMDDLGDEEGMEDDLGDGDMDDLGGDEGMEDDLGDGDMDDLGGDEGMEDEFDPRQVKEGKTFNKRTNKKDDVVKKCPKCKNVMKKCSC